MAFTEMGNFTFNHADQADKPNITAAAFKADLDSRGTDLKTYLNDTLLTELEASTDGSSGADSLGMTQLTNNGSATETAQAQAEALDAAIGARVYTEHNYVTDGESAADSLDALDMQVKDNADAIALKAAASDLSDLAGAGRTTETVKGNADNLSDHLADTASHGLPEILKSFTVKTGESITADDVVAFVNGGLKTAKVNAGTTITAGTPLVFEEANTNYISAVMLSSDKVLVAYRDDGNSYYGTAIILSVSGTTITAGTPLVFEEANTQYISAVMLSSDKVLVAYQDYGNSSYGTAIILSVSGTTITAGTPLVFEEATVYYISAVMLSSDKVLVAYRDYGNSSYGTAIILSVSGTTITAGTPLVFEEANTQYISAVMLSSDKVLVAYQDYGNSSYGTAIILSVSGTTITAGTPLVFEEATVYYISAVMLSSDKVLVAYRDDGNSSYGTAIILSVSGTTITAGTPLVFEEANTQYISAVMLSSDKVLVAYQDVGNSSYGTAIILSVSGTTITAGTPLVFEEANTQYISAVMLSSDKVLVAYRDDGNNYYGTADILTISLVADKEIIGIAKESKTAGESCSVSLGPITTGLTGLTAGDIYYLDTDGTLCTTEQYAKIGVAISTTELRQTIQEL